MSSAGDTDIRVELPADGESEQHAFDGGRNEWDENIGHSITNDDDEDNWSRQVETDDVIQRMPSSVTGGEINTLGDEDDGHGSSAIAVENGDDQHQPVLIPQPRPLPTMKEKLVERERQRRVESERARWKRQFAMAAHAEAENDDEDNNNSSSGDPNIDGYHDTSGVLQDHEHSFLNDRNSVAGTVGEDTVAPIETLEEHNNEQNMTYPMERFLQDQQGGEVEDSSSNNKTEPQGVVMERFLHEQPTATPNGFVTSGESSTPPVEAPNEPSIGQIIDDDLPLLDLPPADASANMIENGIPGEPSGVNTFQSPPQEPRVVLRLTEAEIQEMAAIEDASRSNAPPSERDDISELGELVSDFGLTHFDNQNMSQGTPVTAVESVTSSVEHQIGQVTVLSASSSDHGVIVDGLEGHSISSNVVASSAGGDVSLTGNPPSEVARDDDDDDHRREILSQIPTEILPTSTTVDAPSSPYAGDPIANGSISNDDAANEIIVNRTMRPGLFNYKEHQRDNSSGENLPKPRSRPDLTDAVDHIEGFDFDKDNYASSPQADIVSSPNAMWSPGFSEKDGVSDYGATEDIVENLQLKLVSRPENTRDDPDDERKMLLGGVPPAVDVTVKTSRQPESPRASFAESLFSDVRSQGSATRLCIATEAEEYFESTTVLERVFPNRTLPLVTTLVLELPTLFLISGGSEKLCRLIGLAKFTTLIALLPIVCAMSGNISLQASALTRRAIQHGHVKWANCNGWLVKEMVSAGYLGKCAFFSLILFQMKTCLVSSLTRCLSLVYRFAGLGIGAIIGTIAFLMGGFSIRFAIAMFLAQLIGIVTAGFTGTLAPLFFALCFRRDAYKWAGLLETGVQDVVGSFAMIVIGYKILLLFGPYEMGENDVCFATGA